MTDVHDETPTWSAWIKYQTKRTQKSIAELVKYGTSTGAFGRNAPYRWQDGENTPSKAETVLSVARFYGADPKSALAAAGLAAVADGQEFVIVTDPAEPFIARIRERGFPPAVEKRLIEQVRHDIAVRRAALDEQLDTIDEARRAALEDTDSE